MPRTGLTTWPRRDRSSTATVHSPTGTSSGRTSPTSGAVPALTSLVYTAVNVVVVVGGGGDGGGGGGDGGGDGDGGGGGGGGVGGGGGGVDGGVGGIGGGGGGGVCCYCCNYC